MPKHDLVECPKCRHEGGLSEFGMQVLEEDALLVCPNCGAEFAISATLERLPGEGEEELPPDEELPPEEEPGEEEEPPPEEEPDEEEEEEEESASQGTGSVRVLQCASCKREWVGTVARECPHCESKDVMVSTKTVQQRAEEIIEDVGSGRLPVRRAVEIMLGRRSG